MSNSRKTIETLLLNYKRCSNHHGFTLLELAFVLAIIVTLSTIAIHSYSSYQDKLDYTTVINELKSIDRELTVYYLDFRKYPTTLAEIGADADDPWGNPYQFLNFSTIKGEGQKRKDHSLVPVNTHYDLYSMGPDGDSKPPFTAKASRDDIVRANDGSFFGRVSDY